jgi:predicted ATP-dependent serine protease
VSEVSLLGELREVAQMERRKKEAVRLGFKSIISAQTFGTLSEVVRKMYG